MAELNFVDLNSGTIKKASGLQISTTGKFLVGITGIT